MPAIDGVDEVNDIELADNTKLATILERINTETEKGKGDVCIESYFTQLTMAANDIKAKVYQDQQKSHTFQMLNAHLQQLKLALRKMNATGSTAEEKAAARTILAQMVVMLERFRYGMDPTAEWASTFFECRRNQKRAEALGIIERQKQCFEVLAEAYGKKVNKPTLVWTICRALLLIGAALCSLPFTYGIPVVGVGLAAIGGFFANAFITMNLGLLGGKILANVLLAAGLSAGNFGLTQQESLIGSSPEGTLAPKGFFEIDNTDGEALAKRINTIIRLANEAVEAKEQQYLKAEQGTINPEYIRDDRYDRFRNTNLGPT
jgi:hypothetical protein